MEQGHAGNPGFSKYEALNMLSKQAGLAHFSVYTITLRNFVVPTRSVW
jgi:hypothetical protein